MSMQFGPHTLKKCRYGWMLYSGPTIGKCFELYGEYSESEIAAMRRFIRPGDTVLDIGANIGDLTLPLSQMVGPTGRVYAVESHPDIYNMLCANLALNQISNVQPINAFLQDESATIASHLFRQGWECKRLKIDDIGLQSCRLIKIDVDGNELDVLHSGRATINRFRPVLYLENDVVDKSKALLEYLMALDYTPYWHVAPVFSPDNFAGNSVNYWAPGILVSLMVLGVPKELRIRIEGLAQISDPNEWILRGQLCTPDHRAA